MGRCFYLFSLKNPTVCLGCLTVALKNVPIGQRQPIITLRLASRVGLTQDDLPGPQLMISVVEPFVTVCGERFHLFTHQQTLSSGLLCSQIFTSPPPSVYCGRAWVKSKVQTFMESGKVKVELKFKREALTSLPF